MIRSVTTLALLALLAAGPAIAQEAPQPSPTRPPPATESPAPSKPAPASTGFTLKPPTVFGYINVQYGRTDAPAPASDTSTFELRRARIGARGDLLPQVGYVVLWDGADASLKDAFGAIKNVSFLPGLEIRGGQWKTPFGYEQPESDTRLLWVNNSFVVQNLARGVDSRDLGVGLVGKSRAVGGVTAEIAASLVNGAGPNRRDDLEAKNFWGRAGLATKIGSATVRGGGSYGNGRQVASLGTNGRFDYPGAVNGGTASSTNDDTYLWFSTWGADLTFDSRWLFVATEYIQSDRTTQAFTTPTAFSRASFVADGWYVGFYGKTPWNVGPIFRAEQFDRNDQVADNTNERYTVGAYADLVPVNARLIFNYEIDESSRSVKTGNRAIAYGQVVF